MVLVEEGGGYGGLERDGIFGVLRGFGFELLEGFALELLALLVEGSECAFWVDRLRRLVWRSVCHVAFEVRVEVGTHDGVFGRGDGVVVDGKQQGVVVEPDPVAHFF